MRPSAPVQACAALLLSVLLSACSADKAASIPVDAATIRATGITGGSAKGDFGPPQGEPIRAILTNPPEVPPATGRSTPAKVIVELEVRELDLEISEGVRYTFWTFGGTVPGSFIRVRQGNVIAEGRYLQDWPTSNSIGAQQNAQALTHVSWFSAQAFGESEESALRLT